MRALPIQTKQMVKGGGGRFNDLAEAGQPPPPRTRPGTGTVALGRTDPLGSIGVLPVLVPRLSLKAFISEVRTSSGGAYTAQAHFGPIAQREERLGQGLSLGTGRRAAKPGNHAQWID